MRTALILLAVGMVLAGAPQACAQTAPAGARTIALDARLAGDQRRTRLVVDLNKGVDFKAYLIANPYRVIVDLPEVTFDLPVIAGRHGRGLVTAYRYGLYAPGKARIVIDLREPALIDKAYIIPAQDDQPARLVIDMLRTDAANFQKLAVVPERTQPPKANPQKAAQQSDNRPLIVIDPGHGGIDPGARANTGDEEKDIVLEVAKKLRDRLMKSGQYRVIMTRDDDRFVPLEDRVLVARTNNANLFISIHADSLQRQAGAALGATVYTVSEHASDLEAQRLADDENRADQRVGHYLQNQPDDVANILFDLAHRETKNHSVLFARTLVGQLKGATRLHKTPQKSAAFIVLKAPDVPSVLLELGYLSSPADLKQLTSETWREKVAGAMTEAIDKFFAQRQSVTVVR